MSTTVSRARKKMRERPRTMAQDMYECGLVELDALTRIRFPCVRYQTDPVAFFREILGVEPYAEGEWGVWSRSVELIEAVRDHDRVAVKAGRKVSKSWTIAGIAIWYYCSFQDARVIMTSTTAQQVERVLWREITQLYARSGKCTACKAADPNNTKIPRPCPHSAAVDGDMNMLPHNGLRMRDVERGDFREIFGFTSKQPEAVQGQSGTRMMYVIDEASGVPDFIFQAIEGNRAGGAKVVLTGNPTRNEGEFYDAFHTKKLDKKDPESTGYRCITISSEESPNVKAGREIIGGLATRGFIREREKEWGRASPLFQVHVLGEFAKHEEGCAFSVARIAEAEGRWADTEPEGRLCIGLDPAGESGEGDETCFFPRRGLKCFEPLVKRGLNDEGHKTELMRMLGRMRKGRELPLVTMDRSGSIGAGLYYALQAHLEQCERDRKPPSFELVGIRSQDKAERRPEVYATLRDELAASLEEMFVAGLAIPTDVKLSRELHVLQWRKDARQLYRITHKDDIKKQIGRSPDRCDALQLACWEEGSLRWRTEDVAPAPGSAQAEGDSAVDFDNDESDGGGRAEDMIDPYAGRD